MFVLILIEYFLFVHCINIGILRGDVFSKFAVQSVSLFEKNQYFYIKEGTSVKGLEVLSEDFLFGTSSINIIKRAPQMTFHFTVTFQQGQLPSVYTLKIFFQHCKYLKVNTFTIQNCPQHLRISLNLN